MIFRGLNKINLDTKGRITIPVRYKESLSNLSNNLLICTIDQDHCLLLYPLKFWKSIEKKIMELPTLNATSRRLQRLMVGHAAELEMDSNGRILIPKELREFARLQKQTMLVGQGRKFEIWNYDDWNTGREKWLSTKEADLSELPAELGTLSL
jgi:MraZ protein